MKLAFCGPHMGYAALGFESFLNSVFKKKKFKISHINCLFIHFTTKLIKLLLVTWSSIGNYFICVAVEWSARWYEPHWRYLLPGAVPVGPGIY